MKHFVPLFILFTTAACGGIQPIKIDSDPNQERFERSREKTERDNIDV